jgi:hypothetical protein
MNKDASPAIMGVAIAVVLVLVVLIGYKFLGPKGQPKDTRGSTGAPTSSGASGDHRGSPGGVAMPGSGGGSPGGQ